MSEREIVVHVKELNRLEVQCANCEAGILLDISTGAKISTMCPSCGEDHVPKTWSSHTSSFSERSSKAKPS